IVIPRPTLPPVLSAALDESSLEAAIERDSLALANHAGENNFDLRLTGIDTLADEDRASWYYDLLSASGRWGHDGDPLFKIDATGTLPDGATWVEIQQARHGVNFKQTRFYGLADQRWQMRLPSRAFWGGQFRAINTLSLSPTLTSPLISFELLYPLEDESLVPLVADRFSRAFRYLCIELDCPIKDAPSLAWGQPIALTVSIRAAAPYTVRDTGHTVSVAIPSPRVTGYYDVPEIQGDPIESMAFDSLIAPAARLAAGYATHWPEDHQGELLLNAIIDWLRVRVFDEYALSPVLVQPTRHGPVSSVLRLNDTAARVHYQQLLAGEELLPLETIWHWRPDDALLSGSTRLAENEAEAFIAFLDQQFGSDRVIRFLRMLGTTDSLPLAIERTLVMNYSDFVIGWEQWIGKRD
ncbi:MAG: hypothetical protein HY870_25295, partial [Chloroflexi bacterium]|nr:hypothetical protein [Chloroflexota bacterium]